MLDAVAWTPDRDLAELTLLEPACGDGAFLLPAVSRLVASMRAHGRPLDVDVLSDRIRAHELDGAVCGTARKATAALLASAGLGGQAAASLAARWISDCDFLTADLDLRFTHVVANPPYMRWSKVPLPLRTLYRGRLPSFAARGDLCLAFVWRSVEATIDGGRMALLCPDRWLRSAYGEQARLRLSERIDLRAHVEVHEAPVFQGSRRPGTYAGITVIQVGPGQGSAPAFVNAHTLSEVERACHSIPAARPPGTASILCSPLARKGGALVSTGAAADLVADLVHRFPRLAEAGCRVRCGMAVGLERAFVVEGETAVEASRLVDLVRSGDIDEEGNIACVARLASPWTASGELVDLNEFPRLRAHLAPFERRLSARACVRRPSEWYRTIDKPRPDGHRAPKILVAGISRRARTAVDRLGLVPTNGLYAITSTEWPIDALHAVLLGGLLDLFAEVLSPRLGKGSLRFDGYVLGQVRLPAWSSLDPAAKRLAERPASLGDASTLVAVLGLTSRSERSVAEGVASRLAAAGRTTVERTFGASTGTAAGSRRGGPSAEAY